MTAAERRRGGVAVAAAVTAASAVRGGGGSRWRRGPNRRRRRPVDICVRFVTIFSQRFRATEDGPVVSTVGPLFRDPSWTKTCCDSRYFCKGLAIVPEKGGRRDLVVSVHLGLGSQPKCPTGPPRLCEVSDVTCESISTSGLNRPNSQTWHRWVVWTVKALLHEIRSKSRQ